LLQFYFSTFTHTININLPAPSLQHPVSTGLIFIYGV